MRHYITIDLEKAHVKSHFRRDPKTGKLIHIKDYDSKIHGKADAEFHQGHMVRVNNPRSKFHDQVMKVKHYSDKYDVIRLEIPGKSHTADFEPHLLEPHTGAAPTPAAAPTAPAATPAPGVTDLDGAKLALGLVGVSFVHNDMKHEKQRVEGMDAKQLEARIGKIKGDQKLYNFMRALLEWANSQDKRDVAKKIEAELIKRAQNQTPKKAKSAAPDSKPAPAAPPKTTFDPGDKVRISNPRSKHHDKEGVVTSYSDKYDVVRMKLDDGTYTDASPKALVNLSGQPSLTPGNTPAVDIKPDAKPEPKKVEPIKTAQDFPHDKREAWKYSTEKQRSIAKVTGMVPLDPAAAEYIEKNLQLITAKRGSSGRSSYQGYNKSNGSWYGIKTRTGYTVPQWVNSDLNSRYSRRSFKILAYRPPNDWSINDPEVSSNLVGFAFYSKDDWEKAGYDYDKDVKPHIEDIQTDLKSMAEKGREHKAFDVINHVLEYTYKRISKKVTGGFSEQMEDHVHLDSNVSNTLKHYSLLDHAPRFDHDSCLTLMHAMAGPDFGKPADQMTLRDFLTGYEKFIADNPSTKTKPGAKIYNTDSYMNHLELKSSIVKEVVGNFGSHYNRNSIIRNMFNRSSYWISEHHDLVQYLLADGSKPDPTNHWRTHTEIFDISLATKVTESMSDKVDEKIQANDMMRDQFAANYVAKEGSTRISKNYDREFTARVFPKGLMDKEGPRAIGMKIARKSGSYDGVVDQMSKRYWKEVEKQKKLKAKGVDVNAPAKNQGEPPPNNLGCTFKSVDQKTHDFIMKKIENRWDKKAHGGFYFQNTASPGKLCDTSGMI